MFLLEHGDFFILLTHLIILHDLPANISQPRQHKLLELGQYGTLLGSNARRSIPADVDEAEVSRLLLGRLNALTQPNLCR